MAISPTSPKPKRALVVLSGGQDSSTCLLWAKSLYQEVHAITFDYGQKHRIEIMAAQKIAQMVGVESHYICNARGLLKGRSPLIDPNAKLEEYNNFEQMDKTIGNRIELTFVPLRNLLFLVLAANHALSIDCYDVVTGVCAMDNANYPDCTDDFISSAHFTIAEALGMHRVDYINFNGPQFRIETPLITLTKSESVKLASTFPQWKEVLAESHTCYAGEVPPCGRCHACVLRAEGFFQANMHDPLVEKWQEIMERNGEADRRFGQPHYGHGLEDAGDVIPPRKGDEGLHGGPAGVDSEGGAHD